MIDDNASTCSCDTAICEHLSATMDNIDMNSAMFDEKYKIFCYDVLEEYRNFKIMNPHCSAEDFFDSIKNGQITISNNNLREEHANDITYGMDQISLQTPQYNQVRLNSVCILHIFFERLCIYICLYKVISICFM